MQRKPAAHKHGVFINYRGDDSHLCGALIREALADTFGADKVFLDSSSIQAGDDFERTILRRLRGSNIMLAIIGPHWLTASDRDGRRRIDSPRDWVRRELSEAFRHRMRVVPVLTDDAQMPSKAALPADIAELAGRQYVHLRRRHAAADLALLVDMLAQLDPGLEQSDAAPTPAEPVNPNARRPHEPAHHIRSTRGRILRAGGLWLLPRRGGRLRAATVLLTALAVAAAVATYWRATAHSPPPADHRPTAIPTERQSPMPPGATATPPSTSASAIERAMATFGPKKCASDTLTRPGPEMRKAMAAPTGSPSQPSGPVITTPTAGARLSPQPTVSGWIQATRPDEHLWFFLHTNANCLYYVLQPLPGKVTTGRWTGQVYLNSNATGGFDLYAAAVNPDDDRRLRDIQYFFEHQPFGRDTTRVYQLPRTARHTHIPVTCCA